MQCAKSSQAEVRLKQIDAFCSPLESYVLPVKQVAPEQTRSDGSPQSAISYSNRPNIGSDGASSTETFEFMCLQNTQESDLCLNSALKCGSANRMPFVGGCDALCYGHTGRPHRAIYGWTGLTLDQYCLLLDVSVPASLAPLIGAGISKPFRRAQVTR